MKTLTRDPRQLGNAIRRARKLRGWSQGVLAERTALRQATISLIEAGKPSARIETVLAILSALDLELQVAPRAKGSSERLVELLQ